MEGEKKVGPRFSGLITDVDGTITDRNRRIHTGAIETIRYLVDSGIEVVLASGNTACFMDALSKMIGTSGSFIGENGGIYRIGYGKPPVILGDQKECRAALDALIEHFQKKGTELELYSPTYRFADLAFARTVPVAEVREVVSEFPVDIIDTAFAIHIQSSGITKGTAFSHLAAEMGFSTSQFLAAGDAQNDVDLLRQAGAGIAARNVHPDLAEVAEWISEKSFGDGFVEAIQRYSAYFRER